MVTTPYEKKPMSTQEYAEYFKGEAEKASQLGIPQDLIPVWIEKTVTPKIYTKSKDQGNGQSNHSDHDPRDDIAASPKQIGLIKYLGGIPEENMSMTDASKLIDKLKKEKS